MFCSNCGAFMPDGSSFCPRCGSPASDIFSDLKTAKARPSSQKFSPGTLLSPSGWLSFSGHIKRKEFWGRLLILILGFFVLRCAVSLLAGDKGFVEPGAAACVIFGAGVAMLWSLLSIFTRRLHDMNLTGLWTVFLILIPLAFPLFCLVLGLIPSSATPYSPPKRQAPRYSSRGSYSYHRGYDDSEHRRREEERRREEAEARRRMDEKEYQDWLMMRRRQEEEEKRREEEELREEESRRAYERQREEDREREERQWEEDRRREEEWREEQRREQERRDEEQRREEERRMEEERQREEDRRREEESRNSGGW